MAAQYWKQANGKFEFLKHKGRGALVWVSSELAGRWFYSAHRLAAWNGHQSGAEKFTNKENFESTQPDFLSTFWDLNIVGPCSICSQLSYCFGFVPQYWSQATRRLYDQTGVWILSVCTFFVSCGCVCELPSSKVLVSNCNNGHTTAYVRRICQLLVGR